MICNLMFNGVNVTLDKIKVTNFEFFMNYAVNASFYPNKDVGNAI